MKKRSKLFFRTFILILILFFLTFSLVIYLYGDFEAIFSKASFSGFKEAFLQADAQMPRTMEITLFSVWGIFVFLLLIVFIRDRLLLRDEIKEICLNYGKYETDLDVLYNLVKEKESLKLKTVAKAFRVSVEKAMEWGKILESGNLVSIEYPGIFGEPELRIKSVESE